MNNRGFTLIEILVAMLILAVGVLGVASLQMSTYKQLQMSHNFGTAAMLAGDMADRMMANPTRVLALSDNYNHTSSTGTPPDCASIDCTPTQLSVYDKSVWQTQVTGNIASGTKTPGSLPSGSGSVARIPGTQNFVVTVRWDDDLSGSTGTNCAMDPNSPAQTAADLDCYRLTVAF
jgi:type IV pilus assembly protein PilV